jgi:hypothetical protein
MGNRRVYNGKLVTYHYMGKKEQKEFLNFWTSIRRGR